MDQRKLARFRERLLAERAQVAVQYLQHSPQPEPASERPADIGDAADEAERLMEIATQDSLAESEVRLLEKIDLALRRIQDGSYGTCLNCGDEIPAERLEVKPSVSLCLFCQEEKERAVDRRK